MRIVNVYIVQYMWSKCELNPQPKYCEHHVLLTEPHGTTELKYISAETKQHRLVCSDETGF